MKKYYDNTIVKDIEMNITNKNYGKALLLAEKYVEEYPEDRLGPVYKARALGLNGHFKEAKELFDDALYSKLHDRSSYIIAYTWYGLMLLALGYKEEGIEKLLQTTTYEDHTSDGIAVKARLTLCNIYVDDKLYEKALDIISIDTLDKNVINSKKAYVYLMMGEYAESIKYAKKVKHFKSDKNEQMNNLNIGKAYYYLHDFDQAKEYLNRCLTTKTRYYYNAVSLLGRICYQENQYDLALNYANQLLISKDVREDGYRLLFNVYARIGKLKEAKEALDHINNHLDKTYYTEYYLYLCKEYEKVLDVLPHALCKTTDYRTAELLRSNISTLLRLGRIDEAEYILNCVEKEFNHSYLEIVRAYIDKARGITNDDACIYTARQIYNYDEEETIRHMLSHHLLGDSSKFFDRDSVRDVLIEMKDKIQNMEGIPAGLSDRYIVHYDRVGYDESGLLNSLEVITNFDTKDIITIYPLSGTDAYEDEEVIKPKELKRESQIDKFNRRYGKK